MDNVLNLSLAELIKTKQDKKDTPEQAANAPETKESENTADSTPNKATGRAKKSGITKPTSDERKSIVGQNRENLPESEPTPEQTAEQTAKVELLNTEIEL